MDSSNIFFLVFIATIIVTRIFLYLKPTPSPTVKGLRLHHYMYGIIILAIGIISNNHVIFAIGFGLFIDELPFLIIGGRNHEDNYSTKSLVGLFIFIIIVFIFREPVSAIV